jgi:uncharacterized protein (TIGR03067 family)
MSLTHPRKDQLVAFGQGKLGEVESSQVESHLEQCEQCCETLLDLKDDTFVELVKLARPTGAGGSASGLAAAVSVPVSPPAPTDGGAGSHSEHSATILLPESGEALTDELPPELVDHPRYRIVGRIGQGGMGSVYRAEHRLMDRTVAVKLINPHLVRHPQAVERFRREVRAAARLSHPNIVAAYDAEQAGDAHFLVMEFVEGTDLDSVVKSRGPLPVAEACECIRQAAIGLQHAHDKGMVHRDIKPHNLMRAADGQVRILDFGLAGFATAIEQDGDDSTAPTRKGSGSSMADGDITAGGNASDSIPTHLTHAAAHLTRMGSVMGTPDYIAPEQAIDAHAADIRADIYSLGCTLFYLLTGRPPFHEGNVVDKLKAHASVTPPSVNKLRKDVPAPVAEIVTRMLAKKPGDRFQTPAEVVAALAPWSKPARVRPPRTRGLIAAGWLLLAAVLCGVIVIATDRGRLRIDSQVDNVQIEVLQRGQKVRVIDLVSGSQVEWLPSGDYELRLVGDDNGVTLNQSGFEMTRLGQVIVTANWNLTEQAVIRAYSTADATITRDGVTVDEGGWKLTSSATRTVRLFELPAPQLAPGPYFYRAKLRTADVTERAFLEMWSRFPGQGEFFSRGFDSALRGTNGWTEVEIPFHLKAGQQPDLVKLNVTIEGAGTVWIKDIELRGRLLEADRPPSQPATDRHSNDRAAAEWIVDKGATLRVNRNGEEIHVATREEIPTGAWQITEVCLYPQQFQPDAQLDLLSGLQQLRWMRLFNCQISDDSLMQMTDLPNLKFLDLDFNTPTTDAGLAHFARHYPQLETLCLHGTNVTDAGLEHLAALPQLNLINLTSTRITRDALPRLATFPALTTLGLAGTNLQDDDLALLADFPRLESLDLNQTRLTDAAVEHLVLLDGLKRLQIRQTGITTAGLTRLRKALPNCTIDAFTADQLAEQWRLSAEVPTWTPLDMVRATANGGATLRKLEDSSLLVEGNNPPQAIYTIEASTPLRTITALRLDVLRDDTLPSGGPGRMLNGTFVLTGLDVQYRASSAVPPLPLAWGNAMADYSQDGHPVSQLPSGAGSWAIYRYGEQLREQSLVIDLAEPLTLAAGSTITVALKHESFWYGCNLGRFRLSATDAERPAWPDGTPSTDDAQAIAGMTDLERLQGEWMAESGLHAGREQLPEQIEMQTARFIGNALLARLRGGGAGEGTVTLDTSVSPPILTLQVQPDNRQLRAIYKIAGDRLTLCMDQNPGNSPPATFASPANSSIDLIVFRRMGNAGPVPIPQPMRIHVELPVGVNLVDDPSLEATAPGAVYPDTWGTGNLQPAGAYSHQVVEGGRTGQHGWQIKGDGQFAVVPSNRPAAGHAYRYAGSAWVQVKSGAAQVKLLYFDAGGTYLGENRGMVFGGESGWQQLRVIDDLANYPTATRLSLALAFVGVGEAVFDDLELLAFDAASLPENFELEYGGKVNTSSALFDQWVGEWAATSEIKPTPGQPVGRTVTSTVRAWKALADSFLVMHYDGDDGRIEQLHVLTFDQNLGLYRLWLFGNDGRVFEKRGQWDSASQTLTLDLVPAYPGHSGKSTDRFVGADLIQSTAFVQGGDGQVSLDMHSSRTRTAATASPDIPTVEAPAASPAELAQLNRLAGEWTIHATYKPSVWMPEGRNESFTESGQWILGGRFLLVRATSEQGEPTAMMLVTYEPDERSGHLWHFGADGSTGQWRLTWDDSSRGFHWSAIDMPSGWIGTGFNRWIDDTTDENQMLIKDETGRVLLDSTQDKRRVP